jgi:hypothetical protein
VGGEIVEEILEVSKWLLGYFVVHEIVNFLFTVPAENDIQLYHVDTSVKSFKGITKMSYQDMRYYQQIAKVIDSMYNHHG